MSKKMTVKVIVEVKVRDRDMKVLAALAGRASSEGAAVHISVAGIAADVDLSVDTTRRALKSCADEGYLIVKPCMMENGGKIENAYTVTPNGYKMVDASYRAGII